MFFKRISISLVTKQFSKPETQPVQTSPIHVLVGKPIQDISIISKPVKLKAAVDAFLDEFKIGDGLPTLSKLQEATLEQDVNWQAVVLRIYEVNTDEITPENLLQYQVEEATVSFVKMPAAKQTPLPTEALLKTTQGKTETLHGASMTEHFIAAGVTALTERMSVVTTGTQDIRPVDPHAEFRRFGEIKSDIGPVGNSFIQPSQGLPFSLEGNQLTQYTLTLKETGISLESTRVSLPSVLDGLRLFGESSDGFFVAILPTSKPSDSHDFVAGTVDVGIFDTAINDPGFEKIRDITLIDAGIVDVKISPGSIIVLTDKGELRRFSKSNARLDTPLITLGFVTCMDIGANNVLFVGTVEGKLCKYLNADGDKREPLFMKEQPSSSFTEIDVKNKTIMLSNGNDFYVLPESPESTDKIKQVYRHSSHLNGFSLIDHESPWKGRALTVGRDIVLTPLPQNEHDHPHPLWKSPKVSGRHVHCASKVEVDGVRYIFAVETLSGKTTTVVYKEGESQQDWAPDIQEQIVQTIKDASRSDAVRVTGQVVVSAASIAATHLAKGATRAFNALTDYVNGENGAQ